MEILRLLASAGTGAPVPDRALLRRFRHIVSDLGNDLYVALIGERPEGFIHITYRRHITLGTRARVESLVVSEQERAQEVTASLAALAGRRARRRSCFDLCFATTNASSAIEEVLVEVGWKPEGRELRLDLKLD